MLGHEALGVFALGQGTYSTPTIEVRRRGPIHRRRWHYDPDRIVREWEEAARELQDDIDAIEAAQEAARQAQEAKKAGQRKLKAQALERSLRGIELENAFLLEQLLALKAQAFEAEIARVMAPGSRLSVPSSAMLLTPRPTLQSAMKLKEPSGQKTRA